MEQQVLLKFVCDNCGHRFVGTSHIAAYVDPHTKKPIRCPKCESTDIYEYETLQVG